MEHGPSCFTGTDPRSSQHCLPIRDVPSHAQYHGVLAHEARVPKSVVKQNPCVAAQPASKSYAHALPSGQSLSPMHAVFTGMYGAGASSASTASAGAMTSSPESTGGDATSKAALREQLATANARTQRAARITGNSMRRGLWQALGSL
jgi:hypothetical protein